MSWTQHPHRRFNPLLNEWILVSPHRTGRPWQGKTDDLVLGSAPAHDPDCYLCPGNKRADGSVNPAYDRSFVFTNDFSALYPQAPDAEINEGGLLCAKSEKGVCRVICYSPRHDLTMSRMSVESISAVVDLWADQYDELGSRNDISYVQIFENKGRQMGCSNPHPHGQIWANQTVPEIPAKESTAQRVFRESRNKCLLCEYLRLEQARQERLVLENDSFVALVPFWAVWPYEVMLLPKVHSTAVSGLSPSERNDLADALKRITTRYDNLFHCDFPYSMGIHQQPTDGNEHPEWHVHFHFLPPLLRSATVQKFMVGYELLAMPQRDITAELAAERLRGLSDKHYQE
ncbi:MAG: UDP-glucose--hexose-1-phosphate uridylyltransferase [Chitinispirillaceae bacterium]|nr:UDP-glucose--hexose-1-phosphate uridylyltransferase [Chitinispirillaceae bacterium]